VTSERSASTEFPCAIGRCSRSDIVSSLERASAAVSKRFDHAAPGSGRLREGQHGDTC
jgi:hypothetical protein